MTYFWGLVLGLEVAFAQPGVRVLDGDTLIFQGESIRLACIDAPEKEQKMGNQAKKQLEKLVNQGKINRLERLDKDFWGRTLAIVYVDGKNLNVELIRRGYAFVYPRYLSLCPYSIQQELQQAQREAQRNFRGVWFEKNPTFPWLFRQKQHLRKESKGMLN